MPKEKIISSIREGNSEQVVLAILSACLYSDDHKWIESLCVEYSNHVNEEIRGAAIIGFGHIARIHRKLDRTIVEPIVARGLQDESRLVRGKALDTADDLEIYMKWGK